MTLRLNIVFGSRKENASAQNFIDFILTVKKLAIAHSFLKQQRLQKNQKDYVVWSLGGLNRHELPDA
jgi:thiamine transporter ThiT